MTKLESQIARAVKQDRWSLSTHASERLDERNIEWWQIIDGFDGGVTVSIETDALPNPKILRRQSLADGEQVIVVWAFENPYRVAKIVTVYFEGNE